MKPETIQKVLAFRDERKWIQFHNPKDLALSLSLEASELLENFQWKSSDEAISSNIEDIKDELADVLMYAISMADILDIDLDQIILSKLEKNRIKYPFNKSIGRKDKYTNL